MFQARTLHVPERLIAPVIADKAMRELTATSGEARARRVLELGRAAEHYELATLVEGFRVQA